MQLHDERRHLRQCHIHYAADAGDHILYDRPTGSLLFDQDGTGAIAPVEFAVIANRAALTAADFSVV